MQFRVLYQDESLVAIDKPAGFHVHPPEDQSHRISRGSNCLFLLRKQLDLYLYPVHRLDRATSGVLIFALNVDSARTLASSFQNREISKTYYCVTRGWLTGEGQIEKPLRSDTNTAEKQECLTTYAHVAGMELSHPVGRYNSARYTLLRVEPHTGRMHQIRRHLASVSHPIVGDSIYGDGKHNLFFKQNLKIPNLMLKAYSLDLPHPKTQKPLRISTRWNTPWLRVFELFETCPFNF